MIDTHPDYSSYNAECQRLNAKRNAFDAFAAASNAWENCLCFSECGLSGRYTIAASGEKESELRQLYDARNAAHDVWASFFDGSKS